MYLIGFSSFIVLLSVILADYHQDTRKSQALERRLIYSDARTSIAHKNMFFKEAANHLYKTNDLTMASLAYRMNEIENNFLIPYSWGGSIKSYQQGIDCTGFIHGLMYYTGDNIEFKKRFNTNSFFFDLIKSNNWNTLYDSRFKNQPFDTRTLEVGDIIVWPSRLDDGRNIPGEIWGHVGIVSKIPEDNKPLVTHYVSSKDYDSIDLVGIKGAGINTMKAEDFISLKQRGVLGVFRQSL